MKEFFDKVAAASKAAFDAFNFIDALEIILFALVFYYVFKILKNSNAKGVIVVFVIFTLATGIVFMGNENLPGHAFLIFPIVFAAAVMIIFNTEVKRDILNLGAPKFLSKEPDKQTHVAKEDVERYIADIIRALQNMSKDNIGALIILANDNIPRQVLESGVMMDAYISSQLIEGIFFPKAPLHDGAMVINNYKIQAAGCFLPLTQNANIPKELGTRHRAGIGITETSDVIALIVSEETGIITIAQRGKISRYADYDQLRKTLGNYYWKDLGTEGRRRS